MTKELHEMTDDELNALPEYQPFGQERFKVGDDGKVTLPNGRVLEGLRGGWVNIPNRQEVAGAYWVGDKTPLGWRDAAGEFWRPVKLMTGEWRKERA